MGTVPVGDSLAGIPWKLKPPVFSGDSVHFRSSRKEAISYLLKMLALAMFSKTLVVKSQLPILPFSYAQLRSQDFTHNENDTYRRVNPFLRSVSATGSTIKTAVYMTEGIVAAAPAWTDLNTDVALTVSTA